MPYSSDFGISDPDYLKHSILMINKCLHFFISIPFPSPTPSILITHTHTHTHPASYSPALLPCCHTPHKEKETPKKINNTFQDCIPCLPLNSSESDLYNFLVLYFSILLCFVMFCSSLITSVGNVFPFIQIFPHTTFH